MELVEVQHILSRLYTEEFFRKKFFTDRNLFYQHNKINSPETIQFLNELKQEQVVFFAKGLLAKRFHAVVKLLPATFAVLGDKFHSHFHQYAAQFNPSGTHKHHADASAFCDFIKKEIEQTDYPKDFLDDILDFEKKQIENFLSPKRWGISRYQYNPIHFQRMINLGEKIKSPVKSRTVVLWRKGQIRKVFGGKE